LTFFTLRSKSNTGNNKTKRNFVQDESKGKGFKFNENKIGRLPNKKVKGLFYFENANFGLSVAKE
jgi:hypothetical protein